MRNYLICYDISDEKRLATLSKFLEKEAYRIQKSIFLLLTPTQEELNSLTEKIQTIIDITVDDVRLYTIKKNGYVLGSATDLDTPFILL